MANRNYTERVGEITPHSRTLPRPRTAACGRLLPAKHSVIVLCVAFATARTCP